MVLRNPPYGRNQHYALEGLNSNPHLKWGCVTWQFQAEDSRIKLKSLYPDIDRNRKERDQRQAQKLE